MSPDPSHGGHRLFGGVYTWFLACDKQGDLEQEEGDTFFKCRGLVRPPVPRCGFGPFTEYRDRDRQGHRAHLVAFWASVSLCQRPSGWCVHGLAPRPPSRMQSPVLGTSAGSALAGMACGCSLGTEGRLITLPGVVTWVRAHSAGSYFPADVNADRKASEGMARGRL